MAKDDAAYNRVLLHILKLITQEDPIGLRRAGAPADEYEREATVIVARLAGCVDIDACQTMIWRVFVDCFGLETAGPKESYEPLAINVWNASQSPTFRQPR
jgi:hypothetical protein